MAKQFIFVHTDRAAVKVHQATRGVAALQKQQAQTKRVGVLARWSGDERSRSRNVSAVLTKERKA